MLANSAGAPWLTCSIFCHKLTAARAGYNPNAAVSLWQKMEQVSQGAPAEFASTHPSSSTRIQNLQANIPKVMPLYEQARKR